jgi:hypothetical protein
MTASGFDPHTRPMLSLLLQRAPALAGLSVGMFCLYTSLLTDEEIEIFQAIYRASGILNIRPLRVGRKIHDRYGINSQIDLSRQIRQKDINNQA